MPVDSTKMMTYNRIMISININEIKTHSLTIFTPDPLITQYPIRHYGRL